MISTLILSASAVLLVSALFMLRQNRYGENSARDQNLAQLQEVVRTAETTNNGFFRSLELVQKNLESLLARAESAEQRLRNLMLQPGAEKKEQYTAAALLLAEGQDPQRVAAMLNIPLPQIQIVQELQKINAKDKRKSARRGRDEQTVATEAVVPTKSAAPREKTSTRPILLVDVIRNASAGVDSSTNGHGRLNSVSA
jgi:hypothetical protein